MTRPKSANQEARGKAVMSGPGARKGTKERSFWNRERAQEIVNLFRLGLFFLLVVVQGHDRKGEKKRTKIVN